MYKILLVCAMKEEFQALTHILAEQKMSYSVEYIHSLDRPMYSFTIGECSIKATWIGITYFNTSRLSSILSHEFFNLVINFGTCAGLRSQPVGTVIKTDRFRCNDLDLTGFGYLDGSLLKENEEYATIEEVQVSGSQFLSSKKDVEAVLRRFPNAVAFDMESFAWYNACKTLGTKFLSIRGVSDNGDQDEHGSFEENLFYASNRSLKAILQFIKNGESKIFIELS